MDCVHTNSARAVQWRLPHDLLGGLRSFLRGTRFGGGHSGIVANRVTRHLHPVPARQSRRARGSLPRQVSYRRRPPLTNGSARRLRSRLQGLRGWSEGGGSWLGEGTPFMYPAATRVQGGPDGDADSRAKQQHTATRRRLPPCWHRQPGPLRLLPRIARATHHAALSWSLLVDCCPGR